VAQPSLTERVSGAERELSRSLRALTESIAERAPGLIDDDLLRYLESQMPEIVRQTVRLRALRDAKLSL
jgi:hypothetical protein